MKKITVLIMAIILLVPMAACGDAFENSSTQTGIPISVSETSENFDTNESEHNISTNSDYNNYDYQDTNNYSKENYTSSHIHSYASKITKEATCGATGVRTYTCSCGNSYTESIPKKSYHDWSSATCTEPKKCKICGETVGEILGHTYYSDGTCARCGQMDPAKQDTLSKCSLELPPLPQTISYYSYSGKLYSSVEVTAINYEFEYHNGKISLIAKFSGTKKYDYRGEGQSDSCVIGWKLYDPSGNVLRSGTLYSPNIAIGESFTNKEENLIWASDDAVSGKYKLVISNVN